jgi:hypothetical protein
MNAQRFIAVTSRQSSGPQGKLTVMESRKQVAAEAATGEEPKMRGEARVEAAASYPIVLRSPGREELLRQSEPADDRRRSGRDTRELLVRARGQRWRKAGKS